MSFRDWDDVDARAKEIMASVDASFDIETISNARNLLATCRGICPLPDEIRKGYWSTLCIYWKGIELEVFGDQIEVYPPNTEGTFEVWYEQHNSVEQFSERFLQALRQLNKQFFG